MKADLNLVTSTKPLVEASNVTLQYKTDASLITATHGVSFKIYPGERTVLLGPSGCGKSSLLKAIGGFLKPVEGEILLRGEAIERPGPDRIMVFQEFDQLLPWKTVRDNVLFPMLRTGKFSRREANDRADHFLHKVSLAKFRDAYPRMLSGGMKQRVAIARSLAMAPQVLLMDEPFAALDALTRLQMQRELIELWNDAAFTMIFVTHAIDEAIVLGSRIVVLSPHPGRIRAELNCREFTHDDQGGEKFMTLHRRINFMLFGEQNSDSRDKTLAN